MITSRIWGLGGQVLSFNGLPLEAPSSPYVVFLTTRNSTAQSNYLSYDGGVTFEINQDLSALTQGATQMQFPYVTPGGQHLMTNYYSPSASKTIWSHDRGITWDASFIGSSLPYGPAKCSQDGQFMFKGSYNNPDTSNGAHYSQDGGLTWYKYQPADASLGGDGPNRKYISPQMSSISGQYSHITSQFSGSGMKAVSSSDYGSTVVRIEDIDNPSYPFTDYSQAAYMNNSMSEDGKYQMNLCYQNFQNSSDYGISWVTRRTSGTYINARMDRTGQYQFYQDNADGSIAGSNDYGVNWSGFNFYPRTAYYSMSLDGMNLIGAHPTQHRQLWRCQNFNFSGWYNSFTFDSSIITLDLSSDGNLAIVELQDGKVMYSNDGGGTFSQSTFTNPLAPDLMYLKIS